jgi:acetyl esterase/lipase
MIQRTTLTTLLFLTLLALQGCAAIGKAIANVPASFGDFVATRDIAYGSNARQKLDVYRPEAAGSDRPIVVFLHGGGWRTGDKSAYKFVADSLTARGYVVVEPGYRLFPEAPFPDFVMDAASAVAWTQQHGAEFGGDPRRIFIMGHSAGAHIGALVALDPAYLQRVGGSSDGIAGFIGLAGPYEYLPPPIFGSKEASKSAQPITFVNNASVPLLLLHGEADSVVWLANSEHMAERARSVGSRVEERYYKGMSHAGIIRAFSVFERNRRPVLDDVDRFIRDNSSSTR